MPQNSVRSQMVSGPLQNVSVQFRNRQYGASRIFPVIDRVDPKARILVYDKGAWFRDEAGIRGPGAAANRGGFPTSDVGINLKEYAFASAVTDEDRKHAKSQNAPPLQPDIDAIEFATDKVELKREIVTAKLIKSTNWNGAGVGGEDAEGKWTAGEGNTFLKDIRDAKSMIHGRNGVDPSQLALAIDYGTYESLQEETTILTKIQYTQRGVLTADLLAALLGIREVIVLSAITSTAKEVKGGTDFTPQSIWEVNQGKGFGFLFYAPANPGLKIPSAGYMCRGVYEDGQPRRVTTWREPERHQDVYEVAEELDIVVASTSLGFAWKDTIAT